MPSRTRRATARSSLASLLAAGRVLVAAVGRAAACCSSSAGVDDGDGVVGEPGAGVLQDDLGVGAGLLEGDRLGDGLAVLVGGVLAGDRGAERHARHR